MKKIPTIFNRNKEKMSLVTDECNAECLWVFNNEGVATQKYDGTCCKIEDGKYFKRREVKKGKKVPPDFIEEMTDKNTGKKVGWGPVDFKAKEDKWHVEAIQGIDLSLSENGTYELIGPKIQGNPEKTARHILVKHSDARIFDDCPRTFEGLKNFLKDKDIEGIVFHHSDGRMGKIKKRDFGINR